MTWLGFYRFFPPKCRSSVQCAARRCQGALLATRVRSLLKCSSRPAARLLRHCCYFFLPLLAAQGNFPYPSAYMLNGQGQLPAFPVRRACEQLAAPGLQGAPLLRAAALAAGTFYNHSGDLTCFDYRWEARLG